MMRQTSCGTDKSVISITLSMLCVVGAAGCRPPLATSTRSATKAICSPSSSASRAPATPMCAAAAAHWRASLLASPVPYRTQPLTVYFSVAHWHAMCCKGIAYCSTTHAWEINVESCTAKDQCYLSSSGDCACTGASDRPRLELAVPCRRMTSACCMTWRSTLANEGDADDDRHNPIPSPVLVGLEQQLCRHRRPCPPLPTGTRSAPSSLVCVLYTVRDIGNEDPKH